MVYHLQIIMHLHIPACVRKPDYTQVFDGEATQCNWQTLCLHAEYRVYASHATVFTKRVWLLLSSVIHSTFSFFCSFHLRYTFNTGE